MKITARRRRTEWQARRRRLRAVSAEPRTAFGIRNTMNVKMIGIVIETIVRGSERPETLREASACPQECQ
eukprot:2268066-Heterocapsa_arctica.AAC.1